MNLLCVQSNIITSHLFILTIKGGGGGDGGDGGGSSSSSSSGSDCDGKRKELSSEIYLRQERELKNRLKYFLYFLFVKRLTLTSQPARPRKRRIFNNHK